MDYLLTALAENRNDKAVNLNQLPAGSYFYRVYVNAIDDDNEEIVHIKIGKLVFLK
jgi:hypothetical protein